VTAKRWERWKLADYTIRDADRVMTPALAVYQEMVRENVDFTVRLLGNSNAWRPHVKTSKLRSTIRILVERDIKHFKCATSLELNETCKAGATDVLVAYPLLAANAGRVAELAETYPDVKISALVDSLYHVNLWIGSRVGLFVDINPGMDRTGIDANHFEQILAVSQQIVRSGIKLRGLHYYDGHLRAPDLQERTRSAHQGYDRLMGIVSDLAKEGIIVDEVITSGTPVFPCALSYAGFKGAPFLHRCSPGTVVYGDMTSISQLPEEYAYRPAVMVLSRVISHPQPNMITCDAGHKSLSVDSGMPNCIAVGWPGLRALAAKEEHLTMEVAPNTLAPRLGEILYLLPRHVCPTVNNFDKAMTIRRGEISGVESILARGHESRIQPWLHQGIYERERSNIVRKDDCF
jgi:D-serine deaminase-like pyridoxal phosphate-dependent protein